MTEEFNGAESQTEEETFPVEPRYHPIHKYPRKIYDFFASSRLAMVLLSTILLCCVCGVTVWRGEQAWVLIFNSLWFNALLVLLVVNVACCFFGRIWGRRVTMISFGMILFHLSFVAIMGGVVYNSLFYFRGIIRLTEGEVLPSGDPRSYDFIDKGRFFSFSRLKGDTGLIKMHTGYKVDGEDKRMAYEISVGESGDKQQGIVYVTHKLTHDGVDYFNDRESFSLLTTITNKQGQELYGGYLPLQSILQKDGRYFNTTGYKSEGVVIPSQFAFPAPPEKPLIALQLAYQPVKLNEREGEVTFQISSLDNKGKPKAGQPLASGTAPVGKSFVAGEYLLSVKEVRYWVGMMVRYEPGKPIVLTSLWMALAGMVFTFFGRIWGKGKRNY